LLPRDTKQGSSADNERRRNGYFRVNYLLNGLGESVSGDLHKFILLEN